MKLVKVTVSELMFRRKTQLHETYKPCTVVKLTSKKQDNLLKASKSSTFHSVQNNDKDKKNPIA
jgi:hypothetical protein